VAVVDDGRSDKPVTWPVFRGAIASSVLPRDEVAAPACDGITAPDTTKIPIAKRSPSVTLVERRECRGVIRARRREHGGVIDGRRDRCDVTIRRDIE
jgi:hypothetical protein